MLKSVSYFFGFIAVLSVLYVVVASLGIWAKSRFSPESIRPILLKYKGIRGNIVAAAIGLVMPFCSCTTVPIFSGLVSTGFQYGTAVSFLISSPSINIAAFILLVTLFGLPLGLSYLAVCFTAAVVGGMIAGRLMKTNPVREDFNYIPEENEPLAFRTALAYGIGTLKKVLPFLVLAALIGSLLYRYVPTDFLMKITANNSIVAVPVAVFIGLFVYSDILLLIPVGYALISNHINPGIVIGFMLAAAGFSISGMTMLSRIIRLKPLLSLFVILFLLYTGIGIGYYYFH